MEVSDVGCVLLPVFMIRRRQIDPQRKTVDGIVGSSPRCIGAFEGRDRWREQNMRVRPHRLIYHGIIIFSKWMLYPCVNVHHGGIQPGWFVRTLYVHDSTLMLKTRRGGGALTTKCVCVCVWGGRSCNVGVLVCVFLCICVPINSY